MSRDVGRVGLPVRGGKGVATTRLPGNRGVVLVAQSSTHVNGRGNHGSAGAWRGARWASRSSVCAESRREKAGAPKFNSFLINYHYNLFLIS